MAYLELINCLMYLTALFFYVKKQKSIDAYVVLLGGFAITSVICLIYQNTGYSEYKSTTLFPYIYLFLCVIICLLPFRKLNVGNLSYISDSSLIKILTYVYIITGLFSIYYTLPNAVSLFQGDQWDLVRQSLYEGEDMELYHSQFERLCKNIHSYLNPFGIVMCFYELTKAKRSKLMLILLFGTWLIDTFLGSTLVASRGVVVYAFLTVILVLVIFQNNISKKVKRTFYVALSSLSVPAFVYLLIVTTSRFGSEEGGNSVLMYLGHCMQCFNERLMGSMHDYANGKYAFNYFLSNPQINMQLLGNKADGGFYTVVGDFYIDYGPIGTVLLSIFLTLVVTHFTSKKTKKLSDLVIIVYFGAFYMRGMFAYGRGYGLQWVMLIVVYLIVLISEKISTKGAIQKTVEI